MTDSERRHGTSLSGWCLDGHCDGCRYAGCPCHCHGANVVGNQGNPRYDGGSKTAPGVASTNTGSLAPTPHYRKEA